MMQFGINHEHEDNRERLQHHHKMSLDIERNTVSYSDFNDFCFKFSMNVIPLVSGKFIYIADYKIAYSFN